MGMAAEKERNDTYQCNLYSYRVIIIGTLLHMDTPNVSTDDVSSVVIN